MKVTYIHHSSFCVEFEKEKIVLIFDYYEGNIPEFDSDTNVYFFVSHKHYDHYSERIFELSNKYANITYIISKDIKLDKKSIDRYGINQSVYEKIKTMGSYDKLEFKDAANETFLKISTLKSTDEGVAFVILCHKVSIYHAGDLNWWIWNGLSDEENSKMTNQFKEEIDSIAGTHFDIAFLPLDPRQEDKYYYGFNYFMRKCETKNAFPMHFWEKFETIEQLKGLDVSLPYRDKIINISQRDQQFIIPL